ncbi:UbiA family prenyltransferase [Nocardioides sp. AE5]|uniref:UbiA family prenyltransferase n=1 Tax=Nocardioides sp. AE5 TaxID=2962573 RepID=UPI002881F35C|nr:UbiA family prenyltransferase [Nocardioides sp. AE5]MDT0200852.1 UbiA family prenyltransferase [Nocardioides sp. AE5]
MPVKKYKPAKRVRGGHNPRLLDEAPFDLGRSLPVALVRASHARQALLVAVGVTVAAALSGRSTREVGLVLITVLVGQLVIGLHNDVVDARRDREHSRENKPVAEGYLDRSNAGFTIMVGILLVIPLSIANGTAAGIAHLAIIALAMLTNAGVLRRTRFSFVPWAISFGLFPAFLSYGGWGGEGSGGAPTIAITLAAALLGVALHLLRSLPGLVDDNKDGSRSLPLTIALRTGAPRLMLLSMILTGVALALLIVAALTSGLVR